MTKKIAITGATGFLGKYLINELINNSDNELYLYSSSREKLEQTFQDRSGIHFIETDYSTPSLLQHFSNYDAVVHLSAKRMNPTETSNEAYSINIEHTRSLLTACDKFNVGVFIFASSISVYHTEKNSIPFCESEIPYVANAYGQSKLNCENLYLQHTTKMVNLRFSQLIGWGERKEFMFTQTLLRILNNEPIVLWGEGGGGRDYLYTKDAVRIILLAIEKQLEGTFNIGSGLPISFKQLAHCIRDVFGSADTTILFDKSKTENREIRYMSIDKARMEYGWEPFFSLTDALTDMKTSNKQTY